MEKNQITVILWIQQISYFSKFSPGANFKVPKVLTEDGLIIGYLATVVYLMSLPSGLSYFCLRESGA